MIDVNQRRQLITDCMQGIKDVMQQQGVTRASLEDIKPLLNALAEHTELWMTPEFPEPVSPEFTTFYLIHKDPETGYALYLNIMSPGEVTPIHNHTTWACIAAIKGIETNYLYKRMDDGSRKNVAQLEQSGVMSVGPGTGIAMLPDDIHAVKNVGDSVVWHLHLYGCDVKELTHRIMFDLEDNSYDYMPLITVDHWRELGNKK